MSNPNKGVNNSTVANGNGNVNDTAPGNANNDNNANTNGVDNIDNATYAAFEESFIGPTGISFSINTSGNLIMTV